MSMALSVQKPASDLSSPIVTQLLISQQPLYGRHFSEEALHQKLSMYGLGTCSIKVAINEYLQILIKGDAQPDTIPDNNSLADLSHNPRPPLARQAGNTHDGYPAWPSKEQDSAHSKTKSGFYERHYSFGRDENLEIDRDGHGRTPPKPERQHYARAEQRTIVAQNLSDRTTHKDLLQVVRGGTVLDVFLRTNDRNASISFVEGSAAQEFMKYVKRNDIYIHGKRVSWPYILRARSLIKNTLRLNGPGMNVNSSCLAMSPTKSLSEPPGISLSAMSIQTSPRPRFERI